MLSTRLDYDHYTQYKKYTKFSSKYSHYITNDYMIWKFSSPFKQWNTRTSGNCSFTFISKAR